jgi:glycosyltransferase involved in cell wall biosynthesis
MIAAFSIVHTESSCGWGGQELRTLTEAAGMQRRGHRVRLLCPEDAPMHAHALKLGVPVTALPIARKNWRGFAALRRWLQAHPDIDILNAHSSTDAWLAALACTTLRHAPPIVRTRHVSTPVNTHAGTRWLYQRATRHIVTAGEALRESLIRDNRFDPARITSVPTGIDLDRFRPRDRREARRALRLDENRNYLGIVATLRNWKGHAYLLQAFSRLAPRYPSWHLLVVGDGPQRHNLEKLIAGLDLGERARLVGNRDDVQHWFNAFDLFVLPSYGEEGVSQSVMQAMASGLAVVATTVGGIAEAVVPGVTGLLVPPHEGSTLEAALARLMGDPDMRGRFGEAGRQRARERFGIERMLDAMEAVFRRVMEDSACAA